MVMLADVIDAVVGADTHRDTHTLEITTPTGATLATTTVTNIAEGTAQALAWIAEHAPGQRVVAAVEGSRSYGVGLSRALSTAGLPVIEIEQPHRRERRRGKSDSIDAHLAAIHALRLDVDRLPTPRADGDREALPILLVARLELTTTKTRAINQLRALLITGDAQNRQLNRPGQLSGEHLRRIIRRRAVPDESREQAIRRGEVRRLAVRIRDTVAELATNKTQLAEIVNDLAPVLLAKRGVGPVSAARAIASWSHHGRCRNEAAFAALAGASPLEASSGRTIRHRLNRGGDRALNCALHSIVLTRWRCCPRDGFLLKRKAVSLRCRRERCLVLACMSWPGGAWLVLLPRPPGQPRWWRSATPGGRPTVTTVSRCRWRRGSSRPHGSPLTKT